MFISNFLSKSYFIFVQIHKIWKVSKRDFHYTNHYYVNKLYSSAYFFKGWLVIVAPYDSCYTHFHTDTIQGFHKQVNNTFHERENFPNSLLRSWPISTCRTLCVCVCVVHCLLFASLCSVVSMLSNKRLSFCQKIWCTTRVQCPSSYNIKKGFSVSAHQYNWREGYRTWNWKFFKDNICNTWIKF